MTFRHYGGSTPSPSTSWICPSCATEQDGPLKAGCQKCGAGADAKKVGAVEAPQVRPDFTPIPEAAAGARQAYWAWRAALGVEAEADPQEAFMAGVAWAQGEARTPTSFAAVSAIMANRPTFHAGGAVDADLPALTSSLYMDVAEDPEPRMVDQPTLQTILAALAFYRDNVLGYGGMAGQLSAAQVTELITRLSPPVEEP